MKELTFREVIANIKEGEVWESVEKYIYINTCRQIVVKIKKSFEGYINGSERMAFGLDVRYKLQRKEYTFEEAFKAYEEGKEIESCKGIYYKKDYETEYDEAVSMDEIRGKWYIND